ncbi:hypothetical protein EJ06DRAFT_41185 [Trichodelitschia bisporula]|uniref:Uncharacterized protein n=1 Tax=Trichodelitschia bisporula TaxID=703511 RepID=A0A6G1HVV0_9PEZI|nr:hypothetical protein EJ06DRAFT_41185 [Trichodelitschia bisporula]
MAMEYQQYYAGYQDSAQSWSTRDADLDTANGDDDENRPPEHPIASMQGPFEESIADSVEHAEYAAAVLRKARSMKPKERRQRLLDTNEPNDSYNARWRANPSARYHPLSKVLAQIAFGVHLLHLQLAKSNEEVVRILQKHVDEVDSFIQRTEEDLDLALADIQERIKLLKVPMEHVDIFDIMLDDKQFRASILEGNEIIEKVVHRTAGLMNDLLVDVGKGKESTVDMSLYLARLDGKWPKDDQPTYERFETMRANTDAWLQCFETLQMKGNSLGVALVQLGSMLNIMSKRAAVANVPPTWINFQHQARHPPIKPDANVPLRSPDQSTRQTPPERPRCLRQRRSSNSPEAGKDIGAAPLRGTPQQA